MSVKRKPAVKKPGSKVVITREFKAPCALVYRAWSDPALMAQWFAPEKMECHGATADLQVGGAYRIQMAGGGKEPTAYGNYLEIVPNKRLRFTWQWESYAMPDSIVTVDFEDLGASTRLTLTHEGLPDEEDSRGHKRGWTSALKKFGRKITAGEISPNPEGGEYVFERELDAPRAAVWRACSEAAQVAQWWGPVKFTAPVCQWDARPGKKIYVVMRGPNGVEYPMGGEFREVKAPSRLVTMNGALDAKGKFLFQFIHDLSLTEAGGKTKLQMRSRLTNPTPGSERYTSGFKVGMGMSLDRLAQFLAQATDPLVIERTLNAPAATVWKAFANEKMMKHWFFDLKKFKPEPGFKFSFAADHKGMHYVHECKITEVIPRKRIAFTWRYAGHPGDSLVSFDLFAEGKKTRLKVTHVRLETFPATPNFARANFNRGWTHISGGLKKFAEKKTKTKTK